MFKIKKKFNKNKILTKTVDNKLTTIIKTNKVTNCFYDSVLDIEVQDFKLIYKNAGIL